MRFLEIKNQKVFIIKKRILEALGDIYGEKNIFSRTQKAKRGWNKKIALYWLILKLVENEKLFGIFKIGH